MLSQSNILVTGGTGSLGQRLIRQLLLQGANKVAVYTRNNLARAEMKCNLAIEKMSFYLGDIRDLQTLTLACVGIDYIFHLAEVRDADLCEEQPLEALKTNVIGTQNVIQAALHNGVEKVIHMSAHRSAESSNAYMMTKAIGEKLIVLSNHINMKTKFICVRGWGIGGEIKGSGKETDIRMTRFFLPEEEVAEALIKAAYLGKGGEIFVMAMPAGSILDLSHILL